MPVGTLNPTKDNYLSDDVPNTNYSTGTLFDVGKFNLGTIIRRTLIQFDFSSIPANQTITAGTLNLHHQANDFADNDRTLRVYRVKRAWGDTTSTWNKYDGTNNWTLAGANDSTDRETTDIGTLSISQTQGAGWISIPLTASAIDDWYTGVFTNNGAILKMDTELNDMHRFDSNEAGGTIKPELVVTYSTAGAGVTSFKSLLGVGRG